MSVFKNSIQTEVLEKMIKYEKIEPFTNGYLKTKLPKKLTESLKDICLDRSPTIDDWDSYDFYTWDEPEIRELNEIQVYMVKEYMNIYNVIKNSDKFNFRGWVNIRKDKSWHPPHNHSGSQLVLNTYIGVPENTSVTFMDPNPVLGDHGGTYHKIKPEEGTMIVTPSWWLHWTEPTYKNENRISISTNVTIH